jgi:hypothetical protein
MIAKGRTDPKNQETEMFRPAQFVNLLGAAALLAGPVSAQFDFNVGELPVQIHSFASQGFVDTRGNNWLTMNTDNGGSLGMTDVGLNVSSQITDRFRVGAEVYDRDLGQLGNWHPALEWAVADYKLKDWLGFRGGKVKTVQGLYTDTQDMEFLHTFAILPQSIYPLDTQDATIAHLGGDVYGTIHLQHRFGILSYTVFAGHRQDPLASGYPYYLQSRGTIVSSFGGLQYGADLRWETPVKGLSLGVSRLDQDITGISTRAGLPNQEHSKKDWANQFYGQYSLGKLRFDSEYRRYLRDEILRNNTAEDLGDIRGWYVAAAYRIDKRIEVGSYLSRYTVRSTFLGESNPNLPSEHDYDKVISARIDLTRFWNLKIEGHFMDGWGLGPYPNGFYPQENPLGFAAKTNALVIKTGVYF